MAPFFHQTYVPVWSQHAVIHRLSDIISCKYTLTRLQYRLQACAMQESNRPLTRLHQDQNKKPDSSGYLRFTETEQYGAVRS